MPAMSAMRWFAVLVLCGGAACGDDIPTVGGSDDGLETSGETGADGVDDGADGSGSTGEPQGTRIEIIRDDRGVPHIYAPTDEDAMYGAGYQTAVDRLYQIEMMRRLLTGRLSEVLGQAAYAQDQQLRIFDVPRWGKADAEVMREQDPEMTALISAWVAGVNARIAEINDGEVERPFGYREDDRDFWPEPWGEDDPYIVLKGVELGLGRTVEFEIALTLLTLLFPEPVTAVQPFRPAHAVFGLPPEDRPDPIEDAPPPPMLTPAPAPAPYSNETIEETLRAAQQFIENMPGHGASNNWAVDGEHTANGRPLIAGDPHLDFALMGSMMPMHINSKDAGGTIDVAGFAQPGVPGIALGHTDRVAWTQTTAFGDVMDVWQVSVNGSNVSLGGGSVPITRREETFIIRSPTGPAGEGSEATIVYDDVEGYGTIIPQNLIPIPIGGPYLVDWMGFRPQTTRWPLALATMQNLDDFEAALDAMPELNQSTIAADADGIAFGNGLAVPLREVGGKITPWLAMDGSDASTLWTGETLPLELMPRSRNPGRGFICTANNDPYGFTENGELEDDPFYYGAFFAPGYRAKRIEDTLLELIERGDVELEDMQALQMDVHSTMADDLVPLIEEAWAAAAKDVDLAEFADNADLATLVEVLSDWDRQMARDSAGSVGVPGLRAPGDVRGDRRRHRSGLPVCRHAADDLHDEDRRQCAPPHLPRQRRGAPGRARPDRARGTGAHRRLPEGGLWRGGPGGLHLGGPQGRQLRRRPRIRHGRVHPSHAGR